MTQVTRLDTKGDKSPAATHKQTLLERWGDKTKESCKTAIWDTSKVVNYLRGNGDRYCA